MNVQDTSRKHKFNWDETCYVPEPYLITEENLNLYANALSYRDYFSLFSSNSSTNNEDEDDAPKKIKHDCESPRSLNSDIFETNVNKDMYKNKTTYQFLSQLPCSKISNADRKFYHWFMKKTIEGKNTSIPHDDQAKFKDLMGRIQMEQNEYQKFLHHASQVSLKDYIYVKPTVKKEVLQDVLSSILSVLENHKKSYSLLQAITFDQGFLTKTKPVFNFLRNIQPQTSIPPLNIPLLGKPLTSHVRSTDRKSMKLSKERIERLCAQERASVFITGSTLLAIMESFVDITREWMIPVNVEEGDAQGSTGPSKFVTLADPYPRRSISTRDINYVFYKQQIDEYINASSKVCQKHSKQDDSEKMRKNCDNNNTENDNLRNHDDLLCIHLFQCGDTRMLVETKIDSCDVNTKETYQIIPKIEFQPSIGFEKFALLDLCRSWWSSRIANSDFILNPRIDVRNDCIVRVDRYTRDVLCSPDCPYNPQSYFNHLGHLLSVLTNLSQPGAYLLEHASSNNAFFLFHETENGKTTLSSKFKDLVNKKKDLVLEPVLPWLPIDINILPNHYNQTQEIPWLFPESKSGTFGGGRSKSTARKGKAKKLTGATSTKQGPKLLDNITAPVIDDKKIKHYGGDMNEIELF